MNRMSKKSKTVLIVDDSALMRQLLTSIINGSPDLEVLGVAPDPVIARKMIKELNPDVITLDIEMPKMDGVAFLSKIMALRPMPVVMISSLTQNNAAVTLKALELGAVDFVGKPTASLSENLMAMKDDIIKKVSSAANVKVKKLNIPQSDIPDLSFATTEQIVAIGASTGGVQAITEILTKMPANAPATVIVQHMPKEFTAGFAERLNIKSKMQVSEARHGARIVPGHAVIAPGDVQMEIKRSGAYYTCYLSDEDKVSGHRPSVDVLFNSIAIAAGQRAIGVILTGMGKDGAKGLMNMRRAGAYTIGQDQATSAVYGMCGFAYNVGAVKKQLPLNAIPKKILSACQNVNNDLR